jgi:hypothetical protein
LELSERLLEPESAEEPGQDLPARRPLDFSGQQREARRDERLGPGEIGGEVVVRARVGDAAAERLAVLV